MALDNQGMVRKFYEVFATGEVSGFDGILADDWELKPAMFGIPGNREGEKQAVSYLHSVLDNISYTVEDIYECSGNVVACRNLLRAVQRGTFLGLNAPGQKIELMTMEFHHLDVGKIVRTWHIEDFFGVYQKLVAAGAQPAE